MSDTKQIIDTIFSTSGYTLQDYLRDLGLAVRKREEIAPVAQRLLTTKQACEYLQVSVTTLWRITKRGDLTPVRIRGRCQFDVKDLDRFIRRQTVPRQR